MAGAVVVQVLVREVAPRGGDHAGAADVAVDQEGHLVRIRPESFEDELPARHHLVVVVGGDVGREQLGLAGLVHRTLHRVIDQRDGLLHWCEDLVALRLVVLDEIAAQPELVGRLGKGLRAQAQLGLDDGAGDVAPVLHRPTQDAPEVADVLARAVKQLDGARRHMEVDHLGVGDVAHALVVANAQGEEAHHHHPAIGDVAVEQVQREGDAHVLARLVYEVHQRVHAAGEVVGGADLHVGAGAGLGREMRRRFQVAVAGLGQHLVGHQDVAAAGDQVLLAQAEVGVTVRLVHSILLVFCVAKNAFGFAWVES
jgi:hypothetical protein